MPKTETRGGGEKMAHEQIAGRRRTEGRTAILQCTRSGREMGGNGRRSWHQLDIFALSLGAPVTGTCHALLCWGASGQRGFERLQEASASTNSHNKAWRAFLELPSFFLPKQAAYHNNLHPQQELSASHKWLLTRSIVRMCTGQRKQQEQLVPWRAYERSKGREWKARPSEGAGSSLSGGCEGCSVPTNRDSQRHDRILRDVHFQNFLQMRGISLPEKAGEKEWNLENDQKTTCKWHPEIAEFCPLLRPNVPWVYNQELTTRRPGASKFWGLGTCCRPWFLLPPTLMLQQGLGFGNLSIPGRTTST